MSECSLYLENVLLQYYSGVSLSRTWLELRLMTRMITKKSRPKKTPVQMYVFFLCCQLGISGR